MGVLNIAKSNKYTKPSKILDEEPGNRQITRAFSVPTLVWEIAKIIGDGNGSLGIRRALVWARTDLVSAVTVNIKPNEYSQARRSVRLTDYHIKIANKLAFCPYKTKKNRCATQKRNWTVAINRAVLGMAFSDEPHPDPVKASKIKAMAGVIASASNVISTG
jgi:hypothetical protein